MYFIFLFCLRNVQIPPLMEDPLVVELAKKYGKSPAQILLRFITQLAMAVIPKSSSPSRMAENLTVKHLMSYSRIVSDSKTFL
jgi:D-xylose reductase